MLFSQYGDTETYFTYIGTVASQHRSFSLFTRRQTEQSSEPVQLSFTINESRISSAMTGGEGEAWGEDQL